MPPTRPAMKTTGALAGQFAPDCHGSRRRIGCTAVRSFVVAAIVASSALCLSCAAAALATCSGGSAASASSSLTSQRRRRRRRPTVVVSGATGKVGSRLVRRLIRETDANVVALVRDAGKAKRMLLDGVGSGGDGSPDDGKEGESCGSLSIIEADYSDAAALDEAMATVAARTKRVSRENTDDCDDEISPTPSPLRLFLSCGNVPDQAELELNIARAACSHGAEFCVKLSTASPVLASSESRYADHLRIEEGLHDMTPSMPHAILRPNIFLQMLVSPVDGVFGVDLRDVDETVHPYADRPVSIIDCDDVAACAAAMLVPPSSSDAAAAIDPRGAYAGKVYDLTGPQAVTLGNDLAQVLSFIRPRPVRIRPCKALDKCVGLPPPVAERLASFIDTIGSYDKVTNAVKELTGRSARSLEDFVMDHPAPFLPRTYRRLVGTHRAPSFRAAAKVVDASTHDELLDALQDDELLVRVQAAGVNGGADTFDCTRASDDAKHFPLGHEGCGIVVAAGSSNATTRFRPGDTAVFVGNGGYAEYVRVKERTCAKGGVLSPRATPEELSALRISGLTALVALESTAGVEAGDVVLVTACCGGTGHFAVQVAKNAGAKVIGTVGSTAKVEAARNLGVDRIVDLSKEDLGEVLARECPDGVDIVYEGVGGKLLGAACENLAEGGRVLIVGSISQYPHNDADRLEEHGVAGVGDIMSVFREGKTVELGGGRMIIGNIWGNLFGSPKMGYYRDKVFELHAEGKLQAFIDEKPFHGVGAACDAVEHMLSRKSVGKVCLSFRG